MRRGLTMLELLLSLALLTAVMLASGAWIELAGAAGTLLAGPARWEASVHTALQLIEEDLLVADLHVKGGAPRFEVADGGLNVRTRLAYTGDPSGTVRHRYSFDPGSDALRVEERSDAGAVRTRRLVTGVRSWDCKYDKDLDLLVVTVVSLEDRTVTRSYRLR